MHLIFSPRGYSCGLVMRRPLPLPHAFLVKDKLRIKHAGGSNQACQLLHIIILYSVCGGSWA